MDAAQYVCRRIKVATVSKARELAGFCLSICSCGWPADTLHLAVVPHSQDGLNRVDLHKAFEQLPPRVQEGVYFWRWALAVEGGAAADEPDWGARHLWEDMQQAARALHRSGGLGQAGLAPVICRQFVRGRQWRYFSLLDRVNRNPSTGWVGFVNGGGESFDQAIIGAERFSGMYVDGNNLHCVYNPKSQKQPGDGCCFGFVHDSGRYLAIDGGLCSGVTLLLAQQWIDFLDDHPGQTFLQCCYSAGASEVAAAVRLLQHHRPELLDRLRVISFCGAYIITPPRSGSHAGMQVVNILKVEDKNVLPWATGASNVYTGSPHSVVVPHNTEDDPHNLFSVDYLLARNYVAEFMRSGNILA